MPATRQSVFNAEAKRKAIHICGSAIPVGYLLLAREEILFALSLALVSAFAIELSRLRGFVSLPCIRDNEEQKIGAYVFFIIGAFLSIIIFDKHVAIAAIFILAVGDAASALAGAALHESKPELYGRCLKAPEVMLVMFVTTLLVGWLVLHSLPVAVLGAFGATIADCVPLRIHTVHLDDNLTIPLLSGVLMSFGSML